MKRIIATSPELESAEVMVPVTGSMTYLGAIHIWEDFHPNPAFRNLTLSFFLPRKGDSVDFYSYTGFKIQLESTMRGQIQLLSLFKQGKLDVVFDMVDADYAWEDSLDIRLHAIANPLKREHFFTWTP
jgi:hypothetical protein